jgi:hypothetical protein
VFRVVHIRVFAFMEESTESATVQLDNLACDILLIYLKHEANSIFSAFYIN